jgi:hypothetical protein
MYGGQWYPQNIPMPTQSMAPSQFSMGDNSSFGEEPAALAESLNQMSLSSPPPVFQEANWSK